MEVWQGAVPSPLSLSMQTLTPTRHLSYASYTHVGIAAYMALRLQATQLGHCVVHALRDLASLPPFYGSALDFRASSIWFL